MSEVRDVHTLIQDIRHAQSRMSVHNPHRALFTVCINALVDLSMQLHEAKTATEPIYVANVEGVGV